MFLHHCVEAGLDLAMFNPNHITPYNEIPEEEREELARAAVQRDNHEAMEGM